VKGSEYVWYCPIGVTPPDPPPAEPKRPASTEIDDEY
jgi:hypothetical protein